MKFYGIKKEKGFTLIEMLVVIMIVGMLSTLAINGYTSYRRSALLSLSADDIVSQIYVMRDKVIHGDYQSERKLKIVEALQNGDEFLVLNSNTGGEIGSEIGFNDSKCFGFLYNDSSNEVSLFSQKFDSEKEYDQVHKTWEYKACGDDFNTAKSYDSIDLKKDEIIQIESVKAVKDDGSVDDISGSFYVRFIPPEGVVEYFIGEDEVDFEKNEIEKVVMTIRYGANDLTNLKKEIVFDLKEKNIFVNND